MNNTQFFFDNLPLFIPIIILEVALMLTALVSVLKSKTFRLGSKPIWIIVVVLLQIIGPVIYFAFGREERA
ncbi:PLD nuclease N-terminal domain-containing protein [Enterococcus nangangensis]|uniref:PLD nuclease N-terminal domain-containing protein n=1 Tax=Enterococcus nangangensis TaxID=2559926 RepID=UPI0010F49EA2|nr:PLD nuclease N-terminal domain-containing protein [Enterococcus nangangensis]